MVMAIPGAASAVCTGSPIEFGQTATTSCGSYCYVVSPNGAGPQSLVGSFWTLGFGDPALGTGTDNGSFAKADGWVNSYFGGTTISGSWSQSSAIDGCIDGKIAPGKNAEIMVVEFSDRQSVIDSSSFAAAAVSRHASSSPQFDLALVGSHITLKSVPKPGIVSSAQVGPFSLQIGVRGPTESQLAPGFYSDGSTELQEVISGYRVYGVSYGDESPQPSVEREAGWAPLSGTVPIGEIADVTFECTRIKQYLAVSLVYDSGFESRYLSPRSTVINCEMCNAGHDMDRDGWFSLNPCGRVDCDDGDVHTHPGANEINDGEDNQCPGDIAFGVVDEISGVFGFKTLGDKQTLSWPVQEGAASYGVARSADPAFATNCVAFNTAGASFTDTAVPPPQVAFHYLVRPTAPLTGSWGSNSAGVERSTGCP